MQPASASRAVAPFWLGVLSAIAVIAAISALRPHVPCAPAAQLELVPVQQRSLMMSSLEGKPQHSVITLSFTLSCWFYTCVHERCASWSGAVPVACERNLMT